MALNNLKIDLTLEQSLDHEDVWNNVYSNIIENRHSTENHGLLINYLCQMLMNNPKRQKDREIILINGATASESKYIESLAAQESLGFIETDFIHKQTRDISLFLSNLISLDKTLLRLDYRFLRNDSHVPFVASDSPFLSCVGYFLIPISKCYAMQFDTSKFSEKMSISLMGENQGLRVITDSKDIRHINRCIKQTADRYVYAALTDVF